MNSLFEPYFEKGLAVCETRILDDTVYCRYRKEEFIFPGRLYTKLCLDWMEKQELGFNPNAYDCAHVKKLRKMKKALEKKNGL